jgi:hypothetical protein
MWPCLQQQETSGPVRYDQHEFNCKSYLIINSYKLSHCMKQVRTGKYLWSHQLCCHWVQCRLHLAMLLCGFSFIPNRTWDCPMVLRYVCLLVFLLIEFIMTTDIDTTGWVAACVKGLPFPLFLNECWVISCGFCKFPTLVEWQVTHWHGLHHHPFSSTDIPSFGTNFTVILSVNIMWMSFAWFFLIGASVGTVIRCCGSSPFALSVS